MDCQHAQHQEEMDIRRRENEVLCTSIEQLQNQPPTNPPNIEQPPTNTRQRPCTRYPDVEMFDGSDIKDFLPFKMNLHTKFAMDGSYFLNEGERVLYAYGCLKGRASQHVLPWITAKMENQEALQWGDFMGVLDKVFGDPDLKQKALICINTMKQGKRSLEEYLNDFDEALIHAGGLAWPDDQKIIHLETSISISLLDQLVGAPRAVTYEAYCDQLHHLNHDVNWLNDAKG